MSSRIVCIAGPTASGKTALALDLARRYRGEIINADARQLYRDAPIGTGVPPGVWKPVETSEPAYWIEGIPHHLLAVSTPDEVWTVARWQEKALQAIAAIQARGHVPFVVGGTGLYIRALCEGYVFAGEPDTVLRAELLRLEPAERVQRLLDLDPLLAREVDLHNPHRVLRALERTLTGDSRAHALPPPFLSYKLAFAWELEALKQRIQTRINEQFVAGWAQEVHTLLEQGVSITSPLMQSIGFRAIAQAIQAGAMDEVRLRAHVLRDTWLYARRQLTWLRKEPHLHWIKTASEAHASLDVWLA